jgi:hypothetical protein
MGDPHRSITSEIVNAEAGQEARENIKKTPENMKGMEKRWG